MKMEIIPLKCTILRSKLSDTSQISMPAEKVICRWHRNRPGMKKKIIIICMHRRVDSEYSE